MAVLMGIEGRALLAHQAAADVEARYHTAQAFEEPSHRDVTIPSDEAPEPMSREARIGLLALVALAFAGAAVIGLARLAQRMGKA